jgi:very-short-patch-repair endonuclease
VLGGLAALHYDRLADEPLPIDVYTGPTGRHSRGDDQRWRFIRAERNGHGSPSHTGMGQSLLDATAGMSENDAVALLLAAGRRFSLPHFRDLLAERKHHPHRLIMLQLIDDIEEGTDSVLELRYLRDVERAHKLPRAVRQARLGDDRRCDVLYEGYATIVELDGAKWHSGAARTRDISRDNAAQLKGMMTLRYTWSHVAETPCEVARQVADALRQGGWRGTFHKCPRCA